jgi:hypothetical protein
MRRKGYGSRSVCLSVTTLTATYIPRLRVESAVLQGSLQRSKRMYCVDFTEKASFGSFGVINFADAKLLDLSPSNIAYSVLFIREVIILYTISMYVMVVMCNV